MIMVSPAGWRVEVASLNGCQVYRVTDPHGYAAGGSQAKVKTIGILHTPDQVKALLGADEFRRLVEVF